MIGAFGGFIYCLVYGILWTKDDIIEKENRYNALQSNNKFYFDKNGIMRNSKSGRKCTLNEIHNAFFPDDRIKSKRETYEQKYWAVYTGDIPNETEVFLTKEEAEQYLNEHPESFSCAPGTISERYIEGAKSFTTFHKHF